MAKYDITPTPKPRMTRSDKWRKPKRPRVARYFAFADECRLKIGSLDLNYKRIMFGIRMPDSWSEKKKKAMDGQPHKSTPDLSNLLKALEDALYGKGEETNDSEIHSIESLQKIWVREGCIWIT